MTPILNFRYTAVALLILFVSALSCGNKKQTSTKTELPNGELRFDFTNDYKDLWSEVTRLEKDGLYKSALKKTDAILRLAKSSDNTPQIVKALVFKTKYRSYLNQTATLKSITEIDSLLITEHFPTSSILHSLKGDLLEEYFYSNQWKIRNRTQVSSPSPNIEEWDIATLLKATRNEYLLSIANKDSLQRTVLADFKPLLNYAEETAFLQPTLYDFLAFRALKKLRNSIYNNISTASKQSLDERFLSLPSKFALLNIDSTYQNAVVLSVYQELTKSQLKREHIDALVYTTLERFKYIKENAQLPEKEHAYQLALQQLADSYPTSTETASVWYEIALNHYNKGGLYNRKTDDNRWERKKALEICSKTIEKYPNTYGALECEHLISRIKEKRLSFNIENSYLPNTPIRMTLGYRNVFKIYFKIVKIDWDKENLAPSIYSAPAYKIWEMEFEDFGDYQKHLADVKIDGLPNGRYCILASSSNDFTTRANVVVHQTFWVTRLSYSVLKKDNKATVRVVDADNGKPINGVKVEAYRYEYSKNHRGFVLQQTQNTSDKGETTFLSKKRNSDNLYFRVIKGDDEYFAMDGVYFYTPYQPKPSTQTHFFLDRAIYRPGQTVYFKGIVIRHENNHNQIIPHKPFTVTLYDVNYKKVSSIKVTTNEYGSYSGSFVLPKGALNGSFHISDDNRNSKFFNVEEYKRPKFEVVTLPIQGTYKLNEEVTLKGEARAFAGFGLDGAQVKYSVTRTARFPYWGWYRWGWMPSSPETVIKNGELTSDENGNFIIQFKAIPDYNVSKKYTPTFSYKVEIFVTDLNGETQSTTSYINVGYTAMELLVEVPKALDKNENKEITIKTVNHNGEKVNAEGTLTITKLIEPERLYRSTILPNSDVKTLDETTFHQLFPYDEYNGEAELRNLKRGDKITSIHFNTKEKANYTLPLSSMSVGRYVLEAVSKDSFGMEVKDLHYFTVFDKFDNKIPVNKTWWTTDIKTKGEPEEKAEVLIGTAEDELIVLYQIEHKGEIVYEEELTLHNEQRKISVPIEEKHRGNFSINFTTTKHNRFIQSQKVITVPYTNKELDITFETFRDKLLPGQSEEWRLKIQGKRGEQVMAELLATMYDASLDKFAPNSYELFLNRYFSPTLSWKNNCFRLHKGVINREHWNEYKLLPTRKFSSLKWQIKFFPIVDIDGGYLMRANSPEPMQKMPGRASMALESEEKSAELEEDEVLNDENIDTGQQTATSTSSKDEKHPPVQPRTNFNETAFFFPQLHTDKEGNIVLKFKIPESLTKWKFLALAHTQDLKVGQTQKEIITQKEVMVISNAPRFFREGDKMTFSTKVVNLTDKNLKANVRLDFFDALTLAPISQELIKYNKLQSVTIEKGKSTAVNWQIQIPKGYTAITYRVSAVAGSHSDGEEKPIPVLTNRMLVTESLPLPVRRKGTKKFTFTKLIHQNNHSNTLENYRLTLEFTSNPAWYTIQALPYLMEYPYECAEQTFSRYYANSIAGYIVQSNPKIKRVFDQWKNFDTDAFLSNLEKNQELKALILEETPWVLNASDEKERKKRIALLFDYNKMSAEEERALSKLEQMQLQNGGWPWFKGMKVSPYITRYIVKGFGHLKKLGVINNLNTPMLKKALAFLDHNMNESYQRIKIEHHDNYAKKQYVRSEHIDYLYARSFYTTALKQNYKEAFAYFYTQAKEYWLDFSLHTQGELALVAKRQGDLDFANKIIASLKERATTSEEMGMCWETNTNGYFFNQRAIETQALLIEVFDEVSNDLNSVNDMRVWLLKQKQTTDWKTTKATAEACYALLLKGTYILTETDIPSIQLGKTKVNIPHTEAGTGYFKTSWSKGDIKPEMGEVSITKGENSVAWGALYWQYFEELDKITPHDTPLKIKKELYILQNTPSGKKLFPITESHPIKIGDRVKVRVIIHSDRNLEFVHLKDMRASTFEPVNVISGYRWQDGLGYYQSTKDASTNFFISFLRTGEYVFEYELIATQKGNFSNGITSIQCMYAPEFTSHSEGIRVEVK